MYRKTGQVRMRLLIFVVSVSVLVSLAITMKGTLFGHSFDRKAIVSDAVSVSSNVINTTGLEGCVSGYGGPVPVNIYFSQGRVDSVVALPNAETPSFFKRVVDAGLPDAWNGMPLREAAAYEPDAVSGATYSSLSLISNVKAGLAQVAGSSVAVKQERSSAATPEIVAAVAVLLAGAVIPFFYRKRGYRIVQQVLNVGILGFWTGTFIDYTMMVGFFANGIVASGAALVSLILMAVGFIYPLLGKEGHYCAWICPLGSLQDLVGKCSRRKVRIAPSAVKALGRFRMALWVVLLAFLWAGWFVEWIDYELFTGFIVESAAWSVMTVGIAVVFLSLFVPRSFCRFLCPTGTLLRLGSSVHDRQSGHDSQEHRSNAK